MEIDSIGSPVGLSLRGRFPLKHLQSASMDFLGGCCQSVSVYKQFNAKTFFRSIKQSIIFDEVGFWARDCDLVLYCYDLFTLFIFVAFS